MHTELSCQVESRQRQMHPHTPAQTRKGWEQQLLDSIIFACGVWHCGNGNWCAGGRLDTRREDEARAGGPTLL